MNKQQVVTLFFFISFMFSNNLYVRYVCMIRYFIINANLPVTLTAKNLFSHFYLPITWPQNFERKNIFLRLLTVFLSLSFNILSSCIFLPTVCAHFQKSPGLSKWILDWKHQNVSVVACMKGKSNFSVVRKTPVLQLKEAKSPPIAGLDILG